MLIKIPRIVASAIKAAPVKPAQLSMPIQNSSCGARTWSTEQLHHSNRARQANVDVEGPSYLCMHRQDITNSYAAPPATLVPMQVATLVAQGHDY